MSMRMRNMLVSGGVATILLLSFRLCTNNMSYVLSLMCDDNQTVFAPMFSESSFRKVHVGMTSNEVLKLLGPPLYECWWYGSSRNFSRDVLLCIDIQNQTIKEAGLHFSDESRWDKDTRRAITDMIKPGMSVSELRTVHTSTPMNSQGEAPVYFEADQTVTVLWIYSMTTNSSSYHQRLVYFHGGKVYEKEASFYVD